MAALVAARVAPMGEDLAVAMAATRVAPRAAELVAAMVPLRLALKAVNPVVALVAVMVAPKVAAVQASQALRLLLALRALWACRAGEHPLAY